MGKLVNTFDYIVWLGNGENLGSLFFALYN